MFVLLEKGDGTPICIVGSDWHFCLFCTVPIILLGGFAVTYFILMDDDYAVSWFLIHMLSNYHFSHFGRCRYICV